MRLLLILLIVWPIFLGSRCDAQNSNSMPVTQASAVQLCQLLAFGNARKTLQVDDEGYKVLTELLNKLRRETPTGKDFESLSFDSKFEMLAGAEREAKAIDDQVWAVLTELLNPDQLDVLMGAHLNYYGISGVLNSRIAARLSLTDEQQKSIVVAFEQYRSKRRQLLTDISNNKNGVVKEQLMLNDNGLAMVLGSQLSEKQRVLLATLLSEGGSIHRSGKRVSFGW